MGSRDTPPTPPPLHSRATSDWAKDGAMDPADLAPGVVGTWWLPPMSRERWTRWLDSSELARVNRMVNDVDRQRFLTGVAMTRALYSRLTGLDAADVPLRRYCSSCGGPHGPVSTELPIAIRTSVSHAGEWVVLAATAGAPVGVDVEAVERCKDQSRLARTVLSDSEYRSYLTTPHTDRADFMAKMWVRKEAVVKALGVGLRLPLREVTATGFKDLMQTLPGGHEHAGPNDEVNVTDLAVSGQYRAAVAVIGPPIVSLYQGSGEELC